MNRRLASTCRGRPGSAGADGRRGTRSTTRWARPRRRTRPEAARDAGWSSRAGATSAATTTTMMWEARRARRATPRRAARPAPSRASDRTPADSRVETYARAGAARRLLRRRSSVPVQFTPMSGSCFHRGLATTRNSQPIGCAMKSDCPMLMLTLALRSAARPPPGAPTSPPPSHLAPPGTAAPPPSPPPPAPRFGKPPPS